MMVAYCQYGIFVRFQLLTDRLLESVLAKFPVKLFQFASLFHRERMSMSSQRCIPVSALLISLSAFRRRDGNRHFPTTNCRAGRIPISDVTPWTVCPFTNWISKFANYMSHGKLQTGNQSVLSGILSIRNKISSNCWYQMVSYGERHVLSHILMAKWLASWEEADLLVTTHIENDMTVKKQELNNYLGQEWENILWD